MNKSLDVKEGPNVKSQVFGKEKRPATEGEPEGRKIKMAIATIKLQARKLDTWMKKPDGGPMITDPEVLERIKAAEDLWLLNSGRYLH